jgi:hypothetical protein
MILIGMASFLDVGIFLHGNSKVVTIQKAKYALMSISFILGRIISIIKN